MKQFRTTSGTLTIRRQRSADNRKPTKGNRAVVESTGIPNFTPDELNEIGLEMIAFAGRMNGE